MKINIEDINKIIHALNKVHLAIRSDIPKIRPAKNRSIFQSKILITEKERLKIYEVRDCVDALHNLNLSNSDSVAFCIQDLNSFINKNHSESNNSVMNESCIFLRDLLVSFQERYFKNK